MNLIPPDRTIDDPASAGIIASVDVDVIKIAPKKTYSMGGQDYSGVHSFLFI